jgi:hypothetical protein
VPLAVCPHCSRPIPVSYKECDDGLTIECVECDCRFRVGPPEEVLNVLPAGPRRRWRLGPVLAFGLALLLCGGCLGLGGAGGKGAAEAIAIP